MEIGGGSAAAMIPAAVTAEPSGGTGASSGPDLPAALDAVYAAAKASGGGALEFVERELVARALAETGGDPAAAARILGLTKAAVQKRAKGS